MTIVVPWYGVSPSQGPHLTPWCSHPPCYIIDFTVSYCLLLDLMEGCAFTSLSVTGYRWHCTIKSKLLLLNFPLFNTVWFEESSLFRGISYICSILYTNCSTLLLYPIQRTVFWGFLEIFAYILIISQTSIPFD